MLSNMNLAVCPDGVVQLKIGSVFPAEQLI